MCLYLAKFSIFEGEHEHRSAFLVRAARYEEAVMIAKSQEHALDIPDDDEEESNLTYWDYGDGTTSAALIEVVEITPEEADVLQRLGIVHYFN